jgi:hypothetical protein
VSPVKYELCSYVPEDGILNSQRRENPKSDIALTGWTLSRSRNVSPVRYELCFYIPEDDILHIYISFILRVWSGTKSTIIVLIYSPYVPALDDIR